MLGAISFYILVAFLNTAAISDSSSRPTDLDSSEYKGKVRTVVDTTITYSGTDSHVRKAYIEFTPEGIVKVQRLYLNGKPFLTNTWVKSISTDTDLYKTVRDKQEINLLVRTQWKRTGDDGWERVRKNTNSEKNTLAMINSAYFDKHKKLIKRVMEAREGNKLKTKDLWTFTYSPEGKMVVSEYISKNQRNLPVFSLTSYIKHIGNKTIVKRVTCLSRPINCKVTKVNTTCKKDRYDNCIEYIEYTDGKRKLKTIRKFTYYK